MAELSLFHFGVQLLLNQSLQYVNKTNHYVINNVVPNIDVVVEQFKLDLYQNFIAFTQYFYEHYISNLLVYNSFFTYYLLLIITYLCYHFIYFHIGLTLLFVQNVYKVVDFILQMVINVLIKLVRLCKRILNS